MAKPKNSKEILKAAAAVMLAASAISAATPASADTCSNLASGFHRPNTTITTAVTVPAGSFVTPTVPRSPNLDRVNLLSGPNHR